MGNLGLNIALGPVTFQLWEKSCRYIDDLHDNDWGEDIFALMTHKATRLGEGCLKAFLNLSIA